MCHDGYLPYSSCLLVKYLWYLAFVYTVLNTWKTSFVRTFATQTHFAAYWLVNIGLLISQWTPQYIHDITPITSQHSNKQITCLYQKY